MSRIILDESKECSLLTKKMKTLSQSIVKYHENQHEDWYYVPAEFYNNPDFILRYMERISGGYSLNDGYLKWLANMIRETFFITFDKRILFALVEQPYYKRILIHMRHIGELFDKDPTIGSCREFVAHAATISRHYLRYASRDLLSDRELMMEVVRHDGLALDYASPELKTDPGIVTEAILSNPLSFEYSGLYESVEYTLLALRECWLHPSYVNPSLYSHHDIARLVDSLKNPEKHSRQTLSFGTVFPPIMSRGSNMELLPFGNVLPVASLNVSDPEIEDSPLSTLSVLESRQEESILDKIRRTRSIPNLPFLWDEGECHEGLAEGCGLVVRFNKRLTQSRMESEYPELYSLVAHKFNGTL